MYLKKFTGMKILILILPILFFFHLFLQTNFFPYQYVYTEWLISYEGGFVKRGLGGQIILEITKMFKLKLEYATLIIQTLGYFIYFFYFYQFIKKIKINFFWYLIIFTPLLLVYPLVVLEALGRKDIFIISFFLIFTFLKQKNEHEIIYSFYIIFFISSLIHEITIFYIFHYLLVIYLKINFLKKKINIKNIFHILIFLFVLIFINIHLSKFVNLDKMVSTYAEYNIEITTQSGAISWLKPSFASIMQGTLNAITLKSIFKYLIIYFLAFFPFIFFLKTKKNLNKYLNIKIITFISFILLIPMHLLIYDWGRVAYISMNFFTIIIILLFQNKMIDENFLNNKINILSTKKKIVFFILLCLIICPKLTVTDNLIKVPYIKIISKTLKEIVKLTKYEYNFRSFNNELKIKF
jgi:hypothetical protein